MHKSSSAAHNLKSCLFTSMLRATIQTIASGAYQLCQQYSHEGLLTICMLSAPTPTKGAGAAEEAAPRGVAKWCLPHAQAAKTTFLDPDNISLGTLEANSCSCGHLPCVYIPCHGDWHFNNSANVKQLNVMQGSRNLSRGNHEKCALTANQQTLC